jgi:cation diffusion facilitator family transporter
MSNILSKEELQHRKVSIARLSIISNTTLIIGKLIVGLISGSVSIISEAIHSTLDLVAAIIAFFSVKISDTPPDKDHPYGHGKVENISGVIEAILIFIASIWIIYEAIHKLLNNSPIESLGLGCGVMFFSAVVNLFVSRKLYKVAKETDSVALEADALHLKTDVYTSLGVGVGLTLIWITGLTFLDPIIAIAVALFILSEASGMLLKAYNPLVDAALPDNEIEKIETYLKSNNLPYHNLRTRKAGTQKFIDFHLDLPENLSVKQAHTKCDEIEHDLNKLLNHAEVTIHVECNIE